MVRHFPTTADTTRFADDMASARENSGVSGHNAADGIGPHALDPEEPAIRGIAKDAVTGSIQEPPSEGGTVRESWVSVASTAASRTSGVPSIFSARASTASAMTRYSVRQSLLESPMDDTSPTFHEHRKSSLPQGPRYCCTFCDAAFDTKTEWKLHEFEFHDRRERYSCKRCPATFLRAALLSEHIRLEHGLNCVDDAVDAVEYTPIRSAWSCGFCAAISTSRTEYLEHVGAHYDEGKDRSEWQHTRVIEGLLRQPKLAPAWLDLVSKEENARGTKLRFLWDPNTTGRSAGAGERHLLQDMLEFFATEMRSADEVAAFTYSNAHIRPEGNVSDLLSRLYLWNPEPKPAELPLSPAQRTPELKSPEGAPDDVVSPTSPLPAPLRPLALTPRCSGPCPEPDASCRHSSFSTLASASPPTVPGPCVTAAAIFKGSAPRRTEFGASTPALALKQHTLRRVDSARDLGKTKDDAASRGPKRELIAIPASRIPPVSMHRSMLQPRLSERSLATSTTCKAKDLPATALIVPSAVRPHTSSSTLSAHTLDSSQLLDDSMSEGLSDDSLSEPDFWLESDEFPGTTKAWKASFQLCIARAMGRLWARYNHDWDALIRQCMGNKTGDSAQSRESAGRVSKGTPSRHPPSKGLHPHGPFFRREDDDEEDEGDVHRPPSAMSKRSFETAKRFACPFRKHDPNTYNLHDHEVCAIRSWSTISRLKEHLYRRHYKTHCQRCKQVFGDAKELAEHEMSVVGCEVIDMVPPSDITTYQEKQLKSRKHTTRRQSDEEKWRDIYRLLFANEEIPSPYPEPAEDMTPTTSEQHTGLNFQHFLLTELPGLFSKTAEERAGRRLQPRDGLPMEAIPSIIEEALRKAFNAWEMRGSELPTREASVASMTLLAETSAPLGYALQQSTAYQNPQTGPAMEHNFPQGHFDDMDFVPDVPHASHADDSGFMDTSLYASVSPVNFDTFAPQYERGSWEAGFGMMDAGAFDADLNMRGQYRGYRNS